MKVALILLSTAIILPNNNFSFKSNMLNTDLKPYSQPLPVITDYIAEKEPSLNKLRQVVGIDPIITGSHIFFD